MGYKVSTNKIIAGQQIDIIAERYIEGIGPSSAVIECKFRSGGSVSNQDVYDFISFYQASKDSSRLSAAILVTNTSFSAQAHQAAAQTPGFFLKTIQEVEDSVFDATANLVGYVQDYETQPIFTSYVRLSGSGRTPLMPREKTMADVEFAITEWLQNGPPGFTTLLGDFGAGKTTLLERIRYTFSKLRLLRQSTLIPIFIELKTLMYYEDLDELLKDSISNTVSGNVNVSVFWRLLSAGRILLLLDGFDEVATSIDAEGRAEYIHMLQPLLASPSPVIMTCRPSYFVSADEYNAILSSSQHRHVTLVGTLASGDGASAEIGGVLYGKYVDSRFARRLPRNASTSITLRPLQQDQIDEYLANHESAFQLAVHSGWLEIKDRLGAIYDLRDLMTRPLLLSMITGTIVFGRLDLKGNKLPGGPAELYEIYTSLQFDRDWEKGRSRQFLTSRQRQVFAQAVAIAMYERRKLEVTYADIIALVRKGRQWLDVLHVADEAYEKRLATDVQVCTFLTREADTFRFVHKSFMEFFIAQHVRQVIEARQKPWILKRRLSQEIMRFLSYFCNMSPAFAERVGILLGVEGARSQKSEDQRNVIVNLFSTALSTASLFPNVAISADVSLSATIDRQEIANWRIKGVEFRNSQWEHVSLKDCVLDVRCDNIDWTAGIVSSSKVGLSGRQIRLSALEAVGAQIALASDTAVISDCSSESSIFRTSGFVRVIKLTAHGSRLYARAGPTGGTEFVECTLVDSVVVVSLSTNHESAKNAGAGFKGCSFVRTVCLGVPLRSEEVEHMVNQRETPIGFVVEICGDGRVFQNQNSIREIGDRFFVVPETQMTDANCRLRLRHKLLSCPLGGDERIASEIRQYFKAV